MRRLAALMAIVLALELGSAFASIASGPEMDQSLRDCSDCPEMVVVPAGSFTMGSPDGESGRLDYEGPQHRVAIRQAFAVGKFEVTFAEWDVCAADGGCVRDKVANDGGWGRGRRPAINVSWNDAKEYVIWLSRKTAKSYRLLSEAEWEYVARAGTTTRYSFGDDFANASANNDKNQTVIVGQYPKNAFGLHDMHGNVKEWVEDTWHPNYEGAPTDGSAWSGGDPALRVMRGGSWHEAPLSLRSAFRGWAPSNWRAPSLGFRVARNM
jgi:formylglycine-generating enzyme required for sulfatase activity